jgi:hypothetical protein
MHFQVNRHNCSMSNAILIIKHLLGYNNCEKCTRQSQKSEECSRRRNKKMKKRRRHLLSTSTLRLCSSSRERSTSAFYIHGAFNLWRLRARSPIQPDKCRFHKIYGSNCMFPYYGVLAGSLGCLHAYIMAQHSAHSACSQRC